MAQFLAFGNLTADGNDLSIQAWFNDVNNHIRASRTSGRVYHGNATEAGYPQVCASSLPMKSLPGFRAGSRESPARRSHSSANAAETKRSGPWIMMARISTS